MRAPRRFTFDQQLAISQGHDATAEVPTILLREIPGALNCHRAHPSNDRNGIDWWVEMHGNRLLGVDEKIRPRDYRQNDLALESWSVIERQIVGWTRNSHKRTDYILWFWLDTRRWCLLPFAMLCAVYQRRWVEWRQRFRTMKQPNDRPDGSTYTSECTFVPIDEVWSAIYDQFSGAAKAEG